MGYIYFHCAITLIPQQDQDGTFSLDEDDFRVVEIFKKVKDAQNAINAGSDLGPPYGEYNLRTLKWIAGIEEDRIPINKDDLCRDATLKIDGDLNLIPLEENFNPYAVRKAEAGVIEGNETFSSTYHALETF